MAQIKHLDPFVHLLYEANRFDDMADANEDDQPLCQRHRDEANRLRSNWRAHQPPVDATITYFSEKFNCREGFCSRIAICRRVGRCAGARI